MIDQTKAKIFLSGQRGHSENAWFRSYSTFNFGAYFHEDKMPAGALYVLNDDTLAAGKNVRLTVEEPTLAVILPVTGVLEIRSGAGPEALVKAGEAWAGFLATGYKLEIGNPFDEGLVNYLQLWFKASASSFPSSLFPFSLEEHKNELVEIFESSREESFLSISLAKLEARKELSYALQSPHNRLFVFVIEGAFEVQHRLLENRDGLTLWETGEIELEALSNDAILLLVEMAD